MDIWLKAVYGAFCVAGIAIDTYSLVRYVQRFRRPDAPSGVPLAGLILYVLAGMFRVFTNIGSIFVQWELIVLVGYHVFCHVVVPLTGRSLFGRKTRDA